MPAAARKQAHILPDRLAPNLRVWFVGTAAGPRSAAVGAYYAHPGNRFWRALHQAKITPRLFEPHEYPELLDLGIGLPDFCKVSWGVDADIDRAHFDTVAFARKVVRLKPQALAFTSKTAASLWLGRPTGRIAPGLQPHSEGPAVFVLPSPSGLATSYWSLAPWKQLAAWIERPAIVSANRTGKQIAKKQIDRSVNEGKTIRVRGAPGGAQMAGLCGPRRQGAAG